MGFYFETSRYLARTARLTRAVRLMVCVIQPVNMGAEMKRTIYYVHRGSAEEIMREERRRSSAFFMEWKRRKEKRERKRWKESAACSYMVFLLV